LGLVWASWCEPCHELAQVTNAVWQRHRDRGLGLIGFCLDADPVTAVDALAAGGLQFPCLRIPNSLQQGGGPVRGLPMLFLVSDQGLILRRFEGLISAETLERALEPWLESASPVAKEK
jgi:hypothetical protein